MDDQKPRIQQKEVMKKLNIKLLSLLGLSFIFAGIFWQFGKTNLNSEEASNSPGYYEFYKYLRQTKEGILPSNLLRRYFEHDKKYLGVSKGLLNMDQPIHHGPDSTGGRTRCVHIDISDTSTLFAGSVSGGIWRSNDAGASWSAIDDYAPTLAVSAITQSPFDTDIIYYTTGEAVGTSRGFGPPDERVINGLGIFRSTDHGNTFEHLEHTIDFESTWDIAHSLVYESTIYVATASKGLQRSTDGGESFERIYDFTGDIFEIEVFEDSTIMIAVQGQGVVKIDERTLSATVLDFGWSGSFYRVSFDYCKEHPQVMYAIATNTQTFQAIYKTSNGGQSWVEITTPDSIRFQQAYYDLKIGVAPWDSNFVVLGAIEEVYSLNGGQVWNTLDRTKPSSNDVSGIYSHVDRHEITFYAKDSFIDGNDGGIYRFSLPNLKVASDLNKGYNATQFHAGNYGPEGIKMVAGSQDNGSHTNMYNNDRWGIAMWADGSYCAIHQQEPDFLYISWQNMNLRRLYFPDRDIDRIDRGSSGLIHDDNSTWFIHPFEVNPLDGDQLYITTKAAAFRSTNKGQSWSQITNTTIGESFLHWTQQRRRSCCICRWFCISNLST